MSRRTLARQWTDEEGDLAARIVEAVLLADGQLVGSLQVARGAGLPVGPKDREASRRRIYDVMPLAVILCRTRCPGKALLVGTDGTYRITDSEPESLRVVLHRMRKMHTQHRRISAEIEPIRKGKDLKSIVMVTAVDTMMAAMREEFMDAVLAELNDERDNGKG